jgi:hypothetical protein
MFFYAVSTVQQKYFPLLTAEERKKASIITLGGTDFAIFTDNTAQYTVRIK